MGNWIDWSMPAIHLPHSHYPYDAMLSTLKKAILDRTNLPREDSHSEKTEEDPEELLALIPGEEEDDFVEIQHRHYTPTPADPLTPTLDHFKEAGSTPLGLWHETQCGPTPSHLNHPRSLFNSM